MLSQSELTDDQKKKIVFRLYSEYKKDFPEVDDIGPKEALKLFQTGGIVFVDVRNPAEIKV